MAIYRTWFVAASLLLISMALGACGSDDCPEGMDCEALERTVLLLQSVPRNGAWTWVPVEGSRCGLSSEATGLAVNRVAGHPEGLLIFLNGGGACWNQVTCESDTLAGYLDGFGPEEWAGIEAAAAEAGNFGYFDRDIAVSPFRNYDMIFVPYCTGDMHVGSAVVHYDDGAEMHHIGYKNYGLFLEALKRAFSDASRVLLSGGSAGGYGSTWNFDRTRRAFGCVPVDMYADSGVPVGPDVLTPDLQAKWVAAWQQDRTVPAGCGSLCSDTRFDSVFRYNVATYGDSRFAFDSSVADEVVRSMFSFGFEGLFPPIIPEDLFREGLDAFARLAETTSNARVFYVDRGMERMGFRDWVEYRTWHVFWKTEPGNAHIKVTGHPDADLARWLDLFLHGNEGWGSVVPPL